MTVPSARDNGEREDRMELTPGAAPKAVANGRTFEEFLTETGKSVVKGAVVVAWHAGAAAVVLPLLTGAMGCVLAPPTRVVVPLCGGSENTVIKVTTISAMVLSGIIVGSSLMASFNRLLSDEKEID